MSDYDEDRNRFRYRYYDDDFDYEGGYGRRPEENRGVYGRGTDFERGAYGRGSNYERGGYGQNPGRDMQGRGQMGQGNFNPDWDYDRGNYIRSGYGTGYDRSYDYNRGSFGRGMDYDRGYYNQDYTQDYSRYGQNRGQMNRGMGSQGWDYNRGYSGQSNMSRRNQGYGYNRGMSSMDWDESDPDFVSDFNPVDFTYMEFWMIPGPETGRGPQGYQRSDDRIKEDVCDRLMQHGQIDASEMTVDVQNREVTLNGTVNNRKAKRMAEDMAESVPGVTNVHNQLKVRQEEHRGRSQHQMEQTQQTQSREMGMAGQTGQQTDKR
jgi:osmotically-inducible protein OsmY